MPKRRRRISTGKRPRSPQLLIEGELPCRFRADPAQIPGRRSFHDRQNIFGTDDDQAIRLPHVGGKLGKQLVRGDPYGAGYAELMPDLCLEEICDPLRAAEQPGRAGNVEKGLVYAENLEQRGVLPHQHDDTGRSPGVLAVVADDEDQVRAFLPGLPNRHAGLHPVRPRLVGAGGYHRPCGRAYDGDGPAAQGGVGLLLHGREKGVHVYMHDDPFTHGPKVTT
jgi:hypothetical protein